MTTIETTLNFSIYFLDNARISLSDTNKAPVEGPVPAAGVVGTRSGGIKRKRESEEKPQPPVTPKEAPVPEPATEAGKLCLEFGLNDVDLEYSRHDYDVVDCYDLFQQAFKHRLAAANPKVLSPMNLGIILPKFSCLCFNPYLLLSMFLL